MLAVAHHLYCSWLALVRCCAVWRACGCRPLVGWQVPLCGLRPDEDDESSIYIKPLTLPPAAARARKGVRGALEQ
jgi:hypothetical protein